MLNAALKEEEGAELKRQIRFIFMHPAIWILSGILICVFGISLRWVQFELFNCNCSTGIVKKCAIGCMNSFPPMKLVYVVCTQPSARL